MSSFGPGAGDRAFSSAVDQVPIMASIGDSNSILPRPGDSTFLFACVNHNPLFG